MVSVLRVVSCQFDGLSVTDGTSIKTGLSDSIWYLKHGNLVTLNFNINKIGQLLEQQPFKKEGLIYTHKTMHCLICEIQHNIKAANLKIQIRPCSRPLYI